ncbi:MAG TPA: HIT family protein [Candidatus Paceibacterota bacterium]
MKCAFCEQVIGKREIARNELACVFPTNIPVVPGHLLVVPLRCVARFGDLTPDEQVAIWSLAGEVKMALEKVFGAEGFNYAWNEGKLAGQSVPHFHLHVLPRKEGDTGILEYEPRKFLYRPGERETSPEEELKEVSRLIREAINEV